RSTGGGTRKRRAARPQASTATPRVTTSSRPSSVSSQPQPIQEGSMVSVSAGQGQGNQQSSLGDEPQRRGGHGVRVSFGQVLFSSVPCCRSVVAGLGCRRRSRSGRQDDDHGPSFGGLETGEETWAAEQQTWT